MDAKDFGKIAMIINEFAACFIDEVRYEKGKSKEGQSAPEKQRAAEASQEG